MECPRNELVIISLRQARRDRNFSNTVTTVVFERGSDAPQQGMHDGFTGN
jgi:hypothetical protein